MTSSKGLVKIKVKPGKIYVLRNPMHTDALVKIGRTQKSSESRATQISSATGVPYKFEVLFEEDVVDCELAEKLIHKNLANFRVNSKREFFQLPLKLAVKAVFEICLLVNKPILSEVSRLVITLNSSAPAEEFRDLILPFIGGGTAIYIIFENKNGVAKILLSESWMLKCTPELLVLLRQKSWVEEVYLVAALPN